MKKILPLLLLLVSVGVYAQVPNNICATAVNLGTLNAPPPCPTGGNAATNTYNGTTIGAAAENPYSSLTCMDAPAADVWVTFIASGNELDLAFTSGLNDANIGVYTGGCAGLVGVFCETSTNGNITTTLTPMEPGTQYWMQISGINATDFSNFTLNLTSVNNCSQCMLAAFVTATPPPTNGYYLPGTTVELCLTVTGYNQIASNWMSGVEPTFGAGWNPATLSGTSAPNGSGSYGWYYANGPGAMGMGWYVDIDPVGPTGPDGNYANNYGDPSITGTGLTEEFCFQITTDVGCVPGADLSVDFNTYSDYETGGYGSPGCVGDPNISFFAEMICCSVPITTAVNETCPGAMNGSATALGQGGASPYDYVWTLGGSTIYTNLNNAGVSSMTGLAAGLYTVTVTDNNGCVQVVDILITAPPCPTPTLSPEPADVTVQCLANVPAPVNITRNDPCVGTGPVVPVTGPLVGNGCGGTITRTWTYTNPCGNSVTATQIITVNDNIPPTGTAPANVTVQCIANVPAANPLLITNEADNCSTPTVTFINDVSVGTCPTIITRTYRITDACGNFINVTQTITVQDNVNPTGTAPANVTVQCIANVPAANPLLITNEADNCSTPTVTFINDVSAGTCPTIITRTYRITDVCGNFINVTQTITVQDNIAPTGTAPANVTVQCIANVPASNPLLITNEADNCSTPTVTFLSDVSVGTCPTIITRTYRITDACGNITDVTQTITVQDNINPTGTAPANVTVQCIANVPAANPLLITNEADNCSTPTVTFINDVSVGTCPTIITRTYRITDACGNFINVTQTITVQDNINPVFAAPPAAVTVSCVANVPAMTNLGWTDNCAGAGSVAGTDGALIGGACGGTITRTWTFTDPCGNIGTATQIITVDDNVNPVFAAAPAAVTVSCIANVPAMTNLGWTDNCAGAGSVAGTDGALVGGACGGTITRTWTYTDPCGNPATATQIITVDDNINPVFAAAPAAVTVSCIANVPAMTNLAWTDNCAGAGSVAGTDGALVGGACGGTITRTWSYTDPCGNPATATQIITIDDNINPVFAAAPAAVTVSCIANVPAMTNLGWTDNCAGAGSVTGTDGALVGGACGGTITRTWTYTDPCGNPATATQIITVDDNINPVFAAPPAAVTVSCIANVPAMTNLGWTDNCAGAGSVAGTDGALVGGACGGTITRTWTYTDPCGNPATVTQIITVDDNIAPVMAAPPAAVTVSCIADVPAMTNLGWTDNCAGAGTVVGTDGALVGGPCGGTITRTWTYTDPCGNVSTPVTQIITVDDNVLPTASNPPNGSGTPPPPDPTVVTDEADNCGVPTVAWVSDVSDNGVCPEIITRTYSVTDACLNQILVTQTFTIGDAILPTASNPLPITVDCFANVPAPNPAVVTDEADNGATPTVTWEDDTSNGATCPEIITRRYRVTDDCGNFIFVSQIITVDDNIAPVFAAPPAAVTVSCIADVPGMTNLGWTDNCAGSGSVAGTDGALVGGACGGTITRTWTYTDPCGNPATVTQIITVDDNVNPVFAAPPAAVTVSCIADVPAMTTLGWTDNCAGSGSVSGTDGALVGGACGGTITRTWTYTDPCGNPATVTQIITVDDNVNPVFASPPSAVTVSCIADVPAMTNLGWTDNCAGAGSVAGTDGALVGGPCGGTITRTWTYTDPCGNPATVTQIITVDDNILPTASNPATSTIPGGPVPAPNVNVVIDEADNCGIPTVAWVSDVSDNNPCPETITRTYSVTDNCGNTINVIHLIVITDPILPTGTAPGPVTVDCFANVPAANPALITDEADNQGAPVVAFEGDVSNGLTCPETITRTYSITDLCGNQVLVTQLITVDDNIAPVFAAPPAAVTVSCIADVPGMTNLGWTDNCAGSGSVAGTDGALVGGACGGTITRTWTYTDPCGNPATVTQIITVDDNIAPVFAAPPAAVTVSCIADVPAMTTLGWTDNCAGSGSVAGTDGALVGGACGGTITRTWTYTDPCGNPATVTQIITVDDNIAPVLASPPSSITVSCIADVPAMISLDYTDNCAAAGTVLGTDGPLVGGPCGGTITRTWTWTDPCGNVSTPVTQIITVDDNTLPTASNPATTTVPGGPVPPVDVTVVIDEADNCSVPTVAWVSDVSDNNPCPETITRTYSVTDNCGNTINVIHLIVITDPILPTGTAPGPVTVDCFANVPAANPALITDEADNQGAPVVAFVGDVSNGLTCPETITRTYSITDICGNQILVTQLITVDDNIAPVFAAPPAAVTVSCIADVPAMTNLGWTDNCAGAGSVAGTDGALVGGACGGTITRTWTYTDPCGNPATVTQIITVDDNIAPVFAAAPAAVTVSCIADVPAMTNLGWTDNCAGAGSVAGTDGALVGGACGGTITRTWTYTDPCGNPATTTQIITVDDNINPVFAAAPAAVTVSCIADVPAMTNLGWTDNCAGAGSVAGTDAALVGGACGGTITRTWTYTDPCGNPATATQIITVDDNINPVFAAAPAAVTVSCIADVPAMTNLGWTDNCAGAGSVAGTDAALVGGACGGTITRTWSYTDPCGNPATATQIITVDDNINPVFAAAPAAVTVSCVADVPAMTNLGWTDNCAGAGSVAGTDAALVGGACGGTITRTWSYTDPCGNPATATQIITVDDNINPVFAAAPAAVTVSCIADVPAMTNLGWTDNCAGAGSVAGTDAALVGGACGGTITRTWSYTDPCGNPATATQIITVDDNINPVFAAAPAAISVQCIGDVPAMSNLGWTDNCAGAGSVAGTDGPLVGGACGGTITRTWSYTDPCGNPATATQIITVDDTTLPTGSAPATVNVECIADVPVADVLAITNEADNCTANPVVAFVGDVSDGLSCPETITRTYSITDDCGNQILVNQTIVVNDVTPPTASNPANISVPGALDVPAPNSSVVIDEADNCTVNPVVAWVSDVSDGNVCNLEEITRTYSVTDDCGNQIFVTQIITILAVPAPIDAGPDITICSGDLVTVTANNPLGATLTWSPAVPNGPFDPVVTTAYTVTADNLGCISSDVMNVLVEALPIVSFFGDNLSGCAPLSVEFTNTSTALSGITDCEWTFGNQTVTGCGPLTYTFQNGGTYDVTLTTTSATGCTNTVTYDDYIYVEDAPIASFSPSSNTLTTFGTEVFFTNNSTGASNYEWTFGDDTDMTTVENPTHTFPSENAGSYVVQLVALSSLGCSDTATAVISVVEELIFYVPNTFTPDGDSYNEYFTPVFTEGYDPYDFNMLIFNRWGEIIWESNDASVGWDGTYGGTNLVQDGTYTWKIEFKTSANDERMMVTGHVNILQ